MTDLECEQIIALSLCHLFRCTFDDYRITTLETTNALIELKKELLE